MRKHKGGKARFDQSMSFASVGFKALLDFGVEMCNIQLDIQANVQKERYGLEIEIWCLPQNRDKSNEIVQGVKGENVEEDLGSTEKHLN